MIENQKPLITVAIPTYNQPVLLKQTIESVLNQTFIDFELIIVDDCSTDNTENIVRSINDKRIKYYKTPINLRPPRSWNYAARLAQGKYFALLPHDDLWEKNFLRDMIVRIELSKNVAFVQCDFYCIDAKSKKTKENSNIKDIYFYSGMEALEWQIRYLRCNPAALLFDLNKMRDEGFWREDYWDDWALILRLAYKYGFSYTSQVRSFVRAHDNNLSNLLVKEGRLGALYVIDQLIDIFSNTLPITPKTLSIFGKELRRIAISIYITSIKFALKGKIKNAVQFFQLSRKINPLIPFDFQIIIVIIKRIFSKFFAKK